jgi:hypothetical protein
MPTQPPCDAEVPTPAAALTRGSSNSGPAGDAEAVITALVAIAAPHKNLLRDELDADVDNRPDDRLADVHEHLAPGLGTR